MAKISISRLFEAGAVLEAFQKAKIDGIEAFVTYLSDFSEQTIRALKGQLTIEENLRNQVKSVELSQGVSQSIALTGGQIAKHVLVTKLTPFESSLTIWNWQMKVDGTLEIRASVAPLPASGKFTVQVLILF